jgi:ComEC/Rec2-related protein
MGLLSDRIRMLITGRAVLRSYAPAVGCALSVAVGQLLVWLVGEVWSALALAVVGCLLLTPWGVGRGGIALGVVVGILTAYPELYGRTQVLESEDTVVLGEIVGSPRRPKPGEVNFELQSVGHPKPFRLRCRAIDLPWRNVADLQGGDRVAIRGSVRAVSRPRDPFSWEGWLWRSGIDGECKARYVSAPFDRSPSVVQRMRESILASVRERAGDDRGSALFLSMALGFHDILSPTVEDAFRVLGLTHLLVVSGYQVSLVFGLVVAVSSYLGSRLLLGRFVRMWVLASAILVSLLYVLLIGAEMSAVRALIAAGCVCAHLLTETGARFAQRWGVALLVMQIIWPWCALEIGVLLTFSALCGIGIGMQLGGDRKLPTFLWVTVCAWLCTSCVVVLWSGSFSVVSVLLNVVLAAPWSTLNCAVGLVGLVLLMTGLPGGAEIVRGVSFVNISVSKGLLYLRDLPHVSFELEGTWRVLISVLLIVSALTLGYRGSMPWLLKRRA